MERPSTRRIIERQGRVSQRIGLEYFLDVTKSRSSVHHLNMSISTCISLRDKEG
jgi:hypothetical protein